MTSFYGNTFSDGRTFEGYSAVVAVYYRETKENLKVCLDSIFMQTIPPEEVVLVCDGPLTPELDGFIEQLQSCRQSLRVLRLVENMGAAAAFQIGMDSCQNDLVFKLGSDDIALPYRAEMQLTQFRDTPEYAVVGGYMETFDVQPGDLGLIRVVPCEIEHIFEFARRRSPFNDATVMYRRSAFEKVGGYDTSLRRAQDYDVYTRILQASFLVCNIPQVLCYAREGDSDMRRRGSFSAFKCFVKVRWGLYKRGFSSIADFLIPCFAQIVISAVPSKARHFIYSKLLRKATINKRKRD